jgi:hypothetical protein
MNRENLMEGPPVGERVSTSLPTRLARVRTVFHVAGIYGIVVLLPQYFLETGLARGFPPPLAHPEHFYGFIGVALAWQFVFLMIARDVGRYRPVMLIAILEKLSFGVAAVVLYARGRVSSTVAGFGGIDLVFAALFLLAYRISRDRS